jgi:hypothetical protein
MMHKDKGNCENNKSYLLNWLLWVRLTFHVFKNAPVNFSLTMLGLGWVETKKGAIWRLIHKNVLKSSF